MQKYYTFFMYLCYSSVEIFYFKGRNIGLVGEYWSKLPRAASNKIPARSPLFQSLLLRDRSLLFVLPYTLVPATRADNLLCGLDPGGNEFQYHFFLWKRTYCSGSRKAQDPNDAERPSSSAQHSHPFQQHKTGLRQLRTQMLHNHELNFPDARGKTCFRTSCSRPSLFTDLEGTSEIDLLSSQFCDNVTCMFLKLTMLSKMVQ